MVRSGWAEALGVFESTPGMNKLFLCSPQLLAINLGILVESLVTLYNSRKHFSYEIVIQ